LGLIIQKLKVIAEAANPDQIYSKRKAITAMLPYIIKKEQDGNQELFDTFLLVARASGQQDFIWKCFEPLILPLFIGASPLANTLISPHISWTSPTSSIWVQIWKIAVSMVSHTDEVNCSVVDTLLQIASVDSLQPYISPHLWSWVNKQPSLPPICRGRSVGGTGNIVQLVRALRDIETLKSYLLLIWSQWDCPSHGSDEMHVLIQEDFSGIEMFCHRKDLLHHLDYILVQLDLGLEHLRQHKPSLSEDDIQQMRSKYGEIREVLLEVDKEAMDMLIGK